MSITVADLVATLTLNSAEYTAGMVKAEEQARVTTGRIGSSISGMKLAMGAMGLAAAGAIAAAVDEANKYNTMLVHIQGNTGMTTQQLGQMSDGIKAMAQASGAPLDQLAKGFMVIHNYGFSTADSMTVLKSAMESALSTGDDVSSVANVMGVAMHEFNLRADQASAAMNVFHLAAQESNATLGQFAEGSTKATNMAAVLGVSLVDVTSAISTLVQSGQTVRQASDGVTSAFAAIAKPTAGALKTIQGISIATGVDLVRDFNAGGLRARGFANIMGDVQAAMAKMGPESDAQRTFMLNYADQLDKAGVTGDKFGQKMQAAARSIGDPTQAMLAMFPNIRAFREVMLLTTTQAGSFQKHLEDLAAAMSGKVDPTGKAFALQQQTMSAAMSRLDATVQVISINLGSVFLPILADMLGRITPILGAVSSWVSAHQQLSAALLSTVAAVGLLGGGLTVLSFALGPIAALLGALSLPVLAVGAAVAALAYAWTHDLGGIQEKTAAVVGYLLPAFNQIKFALGEVINFTQNIGLGAGLQVALYYFQQLWGNFTAWITGTALPTLKAAFDRVAPVVWGWVKDATPPLLREAGTLFLALNRWVLTTALPAFVQANIVLGKALWGWIADATPPALRQLQAWAGALGTWLKATGLPQLQTAIQAGASVLWTWVQAATPPALRQLQTWSAALGSWLQSTGLPAVGTALKASAAVLWQWIVAATPVVLARLADWGSALGTWLRTVGLPAVGAAASAGAHVLWDWIVANHQAALDKLGAWKDALVTWLTTTGLPTLGRTLAAGASALWGWIKDPALPAALREIGSLATKLGDWLRDVGLPELGRTLAAGASALWGWIKDPAVPRALAEVGALTTKLGDWLRDVGLPTMGRELAKGASALWGWIKDPAVPQALAQLDAWSRSLITWIVTTGLPNLSAVIKGGASLLWQWIEDAAPQVLTAAQGWATGLKKDLTDALKTANTWLEQAGKDVVQGLINGIGDMKTPLGNRAKDLWSWVSGPFAAAGKILSPSKVFYDFGVNIGQGLINGLTAMQGPIGAAMAALGAGVKGAMTTALGIPAGGGASTIALALGGFFGDGFIKGLQGSTGAITTAVQDYLINPTIAAIHNSLGAPAGFTIAQTYATDVAAGLKATAPTVKTAAKTLGEHVTSGTAEGMGVSLTGQEASGKGMLLGGNFGKSIEAGLGKEAPVALSLFGRFGIDLATATASGLTETITAGIGTASSGFFGALAAAGRLAATTFHAAVGGPVSSGIGVDPLYAQFVSQLSTAGDASAPAVSSIGQKLGKAMTDGFGAAVTNGITIAAILAAAGTASAPQTLAQSLDANHGVVTNWQKPGFQQYPTTAAEFAQAYGNGAVWQQGFGPQIAAATTQAAQTAASAQVATNTQATAAATKAMTGDMATILKQLGAQVEVSADLQGQLSGAATLQSLSAVKDQAHAQFLADIQSAIGQQNQAQVTYLQGQDRALNLDYTLEASQLRQVTNAQTLMDAAKNTLATDQARLQTAQQAYQTAQNTLSTAQQNLNMLTANQAGQDAINKLRIPYDAQHLAQTVQMQKLTSDYNLSNISLTQQIQQARQAGNTQLAQQLTDQQQAQTDNYNVQRQQLQDTMQGANDVYQAQMQQLQDVQQKQAQADALTKAKEAVAAAQKLEADKKAAADSAQAKVDADQKAVDKTTAAWQKASADKKRFDDAAMVNANTDATTTANLIAKYAGDQLTQIDNISAEQTKAFALRLSQIQTVATALGIAGDVSTAATTGAAGGTSGGAGGTSGGAGGTTVVGGSAGTPVPGLTLQPGARAPIIGGSTIPGNPGYSGPSAGTPSGGSGGSGGSVGGGGGPLLSAAQLQAMSTNGAIGPGAFTQGDVNRLLNTYIAAQNNPTLTNLSSAIADLKTAFNDGLKLPDAVITQLGLSQPNSTYGLHTASAGSVSPAAPPLQAASSGNVPVNITVNMANGSVQVTGGAGGTADFAQQIAKAVSDAISTLVMSQKTSSVGAHSQTPGAR